MMALISVRHLVVVKPEMMPDLVHDFFLGATESENRAAVDGDSRKRSQTDCGKNAESRLYA